MSTSKRKVPKQMSRKHEKEEIAEIERKLLVKKFLSNKIPLERDVTRFSQLPLSSKTLQGLTAANFIEMTEIQKDSIFTALSGKDILGAAKTGSGKTLAFLVPILERLYRINWCSEDGLGALIISPTRELAVQIFQVLAKIGKYHSFSAGLVIGGHSLKEEQARICKMSILVCTPGRLLQHMDQTAGFETSNLQLLVLDEADRILDLGFSKALNAIVKHLPKERQTLLFSATQTSCVKDLARLSLSNPEYIAVHNHDEHATPSKLNQCYVMTLLDQKLDVLFSFIKKNIHSKMIVFLSSCKQVRFVHETFCKMQPGVILQCLHGKQKQAKRSAIFTDFCRKQHIVLFATDIAARGLDFPAVDWVVQVDCPEDPAAYIHRVGRTARYESVGNAVLFLMPSETAILDQLEKKKIPIKEMPLNQLVPKKQSIQQELTAFCTQSPEIKYLGQKALTCYVRSVFLQGNKHVFKVNELPIAEFANSLGLPGAPKLKFGAKDNKKNECKQQSMLDKLSQETTNEEKQINHPKKVEKMFNRKNTDVFSEHYANLRSENNFGGVEDEEADETDDILVVRRKDHEIDVDSIPINKPIKESRRDILKTKKRYQLKTSESNEKLVFDDEGEAHNAYPYEREDQFKADRVKILDYMADTKATISSADAEDKKRVKEDRKERKLLKKQKMTESISS